MNMSFKLKYRIKHEIKFKVQLSSIIAHVLVIYVR